MVVQVANVLDVVHGSVRVGVSEQFPVLHVDLEPVVDVQRYRWEVDRDRAHKERECLLAEGYRDLNGYVDPSWEGAAFAEGETRRGVVINVTASSADIKVAGKVFPLKPSGWAWTHTPSATRLSIPKACKATAST